MHTLDQVMLSNVAARPARVPYQDASGALSAATLGAMAGALAPVLAAASTSPRIAICLPTIKEYPLAVFAVLMAGKTVVPINFLLQPRELIHVFRDSGADAVVTSKLFADKLAPLGVKVLLIEELAAAAAKPMAAPQPASKPQDTAILLYTSGTTSLPKGVKLTHANILAQRDSLAQILDLPAFHLVSPLPLFHTFALTVAVMLPALSEARASLLARFDPAETIEALPKFGANTLVAVPSMYRMLSRIAKREKQTAQTLGLTLAIAGGEKLPADVRDEFEQTFGLPLLEGYGLTEHAPAVALNTPGANKPGTIGRIIPGVEWRLVDSAGKVCAAGEEGELQLRSKSVMAGYHNHSESPVNGDGWLVTGDLARSDADGFLTITGRIKELIIAAGKNIHPAEIEDVVLEHAAVAECAVIAMPDKTRGEAPACFVVLKEGQTLTPDQLRDWLHERIADYKMPRLIRIVDSLPHGPTGKVLKRALKAELP